MQEKLVSVIIPTYNRSRFLKEAIQSVLNQSYNNFEIIVIDDGSDDDTEELVKQFNDSRIKYLKREHTGSPAFIRNQGIKIAKGEYIAFLDSDDLWLLNKLEKQVYELENNEKILAVAGKRIVFPYKSNRMRLKHKKDIIISFRDLFGNNLIHTSSILIRTSLINKIGYYDEDCRLMSGQDYDYWLKIITYQNNSILILKDKLIKYRIHPSSITHIKKKRKNFIQSEFQKINYIYDKYKVYDLEFTKKITRNLSYRLYIYKKQFQLANKRIKLSAILSDDILELNDKLLIIYQYFKIFFLLRYCKKILLN